MADPTKAETDAVFKVLKSKKENKVRIVDRVVRRTPFSDVRYAPDDHAAPDPNELAGGRCTLSLSAR